MIERSPYPFGLKLMDALGFGRKAAITDLGWGAYSETGGAVTSLYDRLREHSKRLDRVGDGSANGIVQACLRVLSVGLSEAPIVAWEDTAGGQEPMWDHPLTQLMEQPNDAYTGEELLDLIIAMLHIPPGNAYLVKIRNPRTKRLLQVWPVDPRDIAPKWPKDGTQFISHYEYKPRGVVGAQTTRFEREDVIHLRLKVNPKNPRLGYAPMEAELRSVLTDDEADKLVAALLNNLAVPALIFVPDARENVEVNRESQESLKVAYEEAFGGDNRGRAMVANAGTKLERVSFSPQELEYSGIRRLPEERICAVLGVPPILAGMGAGLERSTYNNLEGTMEWFTDVTRVPLWRRLGNALNRNLRDDFALAQNQRLGFWTANVAALQEDADKKAERYRKGMKDGAVTVAEYQRVLGLDPGPEDEVYLRPTNIVAVPVSAAREDQAEGEPVQEEPEEGDDVE